MRSPIYGHVSTTLLGLPTIRAFSAQALFTDMFFKAQDDHTKSWFTFISCAGWLGFRLELLCLTFIGFVVFVCIAVAGIGNGSFPLRFAFRISYGSSLFLVHLQMFCDLRTCGCRLGAMSSHSRSEVRK